MSNRLTFPFAALLLAVATGVAWVTPDALAAQEVGEGCMVCKTVDRGVGDFEHKFGIGSEFMECDAPNEQEAEERLEDTSIASGPSAGDADISHRATSGPGCHQDEWDGGMCAAAHSVCPPGGEAAFSASIDELIANLRQGSDAAALALLHEVNAVTALSLDAHGGLLTLRSCDGSEVRTTWVVNGTSLTASSQP